MSNKISLKLKGDNFTDFVQKLADLATIEDCIKIKIDRDNILIYSMVNNESAVLALKNYLLKTEDYILNYDSDSILDFIITSAGKFVKNIKFFQVSKDIKWNFICKISPDDDSIQLVRSCQITNGKLKISCIGGEWHKIRDVNKDTLIERLNPKKSKWSFVMNGEDFSDVKKLANINNEDRVININADGSIVNMNELGKWEMQVSKVDGIKSQITFDKKYLSNINSSDSINFSIFDTFILVREQNWNLMLSFEQNFDE